MITLEVLQQAARATHEDVRRSGRAAVTASYCKNKYQRTWLRTACGKQRHKRRRCQRNAAAASVFALAS
jgi:hypothetical protein